MRYLLLVVLATIVFQAGAQVPPGYPPDTLGIFPRLKAARALGQTQPDSAARELRALVALTQQARLPRWESRIRYRLGDLLVRRQQPEALAEAFAVLRLAQLPTDPDPAAEILGLVLLGDVYFAEADFPTAVRYHRQAYDLARRVGTPKEQGRTGASLGNSLSSANRSREAIPLLRRSTELLLAAGDTITAVSTLSAEADALRTTGRLARAEQVAREALRYYDYPVLRSDAMARAAARLSLATVLIDRKRQAEAMAISQEVRQQARQIGSPMLEQAALGTLAEAARAGGQYQQAFEAERAFRQLNQQLHTEEVAEQIAALSTRYDAERREARIRSLTQARRIAHLAADRATQRARWLALLAGGLAVGLGVFGWLYLALRRSRARLAASEAESRQLNATQSRLLSIIGHDARGPLLAMEAVSMVVERQANAPNPGELRTIARELRERATALRGLLDNLLNWAYGQTGQLLNAPEAVSPASLVGDVSKLYGPIAASKGITLEMELAEGLRPVWADPNLLQTVLRNLVANAVKFTPRGGQVTVRATPSGAGVAFQVRDTGNGLPPERLAALLGQAEGPGGAPRWTVGTEGEVGTGLGLAVCRQFAALLGDGLRAESVPGAGSTFGLVVREA